MRRLRGSTTLCPSKDAKPSVNSGRMCGMRSRMQLRTRFAEGQRNRRKFWVAKKKQRNESSEIEIMQGS